MGENESESNVTPIESAKLTWAQWTVRELREHGFAYVVLVAFVIAGPVVAHTLFPDAPAGAGLFGGIAFGVYACLCAMPQRFL